MTETIKSTLRSKREYEAELEYCISCLDTAAGEQGTTLDEHITFLRRQLSLIASWMKLLSEDEAFVTQRHMIDGIDIPRIVAEYEVRWGREFAKSERTIKTYQQRAINRILHLPNRCFSEHKTREALE